MKHLKPLHNAPSRIGLFGGTFNPIHLGHIEVAEDVRQQFSLDQILFIPCALPPHKTEGGLASATDRMEMVRIALLNRDNLQVSDIEIQRGGPSYTVDTLIDLNSQSEDGAAFYFLMGVDAFFEIHTWKSYRKLLNLAALIVMTRPDEQKPTLHLPFKSAALAYTQQHICTGYTLSETADVLEHPEKRAIYLASVPPVAIASTRIRDKIRNRQPIRHWVGPGVSDYIENKGLYR